LGRREEAFLKKSFLSSSLSKNFVFIGLVPTRKGNIHIFRRTFKKAKPESAEPTALGS
jgi:hypothetical protein